MKRIIIAAATAAAILMSVTGCSAQNGATSTENGWRISGINTVIDYPDHWEVYTGDELYEMVYSYYNGGFEDAQDMKELMALDGLEYIIFGADAETGSSVTVSVQDMTVGEEHPTAEEYARSVHDTALFTFMANGYTTNGTGAFVEAELAGNKGYLSQYQLYDPETDEFVQGGAEFMTQLGDDMYSIQVAYCYETEMEEAMSVLEGITSA